MPQRIMRSCDEGAADCGEYREVAGAIAEAMRVRRGHSGTASDAAELTE
jgi:hypothetical protein